MMILLAPLVSNPTPTPSIERSNKNKNGRANLDGSVIFVLTKAQLFKEAYKYFY